MLFAKRYKQYTSNLQDQPILVNLHVRFLLSHQFNQFETNYFKVIFGLTQKVADYPLILNCVAETKIAGKVQNLRAIAGSRRLF